ncbi:S-adenosyl-L-methionine-dependent methyltransferase [Pleomassaria siparia CBS 279.74]|uniref:S-adenosyl-L-methionine-dependent methyltransferase n=1 Tax=Pleomassaria siparia CBS 279.74 TaxID=1314801 RepID=A0A6G1JWQ1_9PLEO|nr:S-adenosyl-L-methionine-dependent methyltransferase [Pleomassaria siparia CBS 279.74]
MLGRVARQRHMTANLCNPRPWWRLIIQTRRTFSAFNAPSNHRFTHIPHIHLAKRNPHVIPDRKTRMAPSHPQSLSTSASHAAESKTPDWSAQQYLKFGDERTRPVHDLVAQVLPLIGRPNPRIYDLGCGPGNSTEVLADAFPGTNIKGMDSSPDMLRKANATFKSRDGAQARAVTFEEGNLETYLPDEGADLLFSNAVFHWLRSPKRIPALIRLLETLKPGGVLAFQVPDNYDEPSHSSMRAVALQPSQPWSSSFSSSHIGNLSNSARPDLDPIESPSTFYKALIPYCQSVNLWRTQYQHVLSDHKSIVEWVKGTGLQPYLNRIDEGTGEAKKSFLHEYERVLTDEYETIGVGGGEEKVLLQYPRLFVVAVRK